jgi:hypothetical protein
MSALRSVRCDQISAFLIVTQIGLQPPVATHRQPNFLIEKRFPAILRYVSYVDIAADSDAWCECALVVENLWKKAIILFRVGLSIHYYHYG